MIIDFCQDCQSSRNPQDMRKVDRVHRTAKGFQHSHRWICKWCLCNRKQPAQIPAGVTA